MSRTGTTVSGIRRIRHLDRSRSISSRSNSSVIRAFAIVFSAFVLSNTGGGVTMSLQEPDYSNLLYGGVWKHVIVDPLISPDLTQASREAVLFLRSRASVLPSDEFNTRCLSMLDLWYTTSNLTPLLMNKVNRENKGNQSPTSVPVSFGNTYNFLLTQKQNGKVLFHFLTVTKPVETGRFHVYSHIVRSENNSDVLHDERNNDCKGSDFSSRLQAMSNFVERKDLAVCRVAPEATDPDVKRCVGDTPSEEKCDSKTAQQSSDEKIRLSVMTYNIWNYYTVGGKSEYPGRILRLMKIVNDVQPDVIGFQEVRYESRQGGNLGPSQMDHIMAEMPGYQFVYQPAQMQGTCLNQGRTEEGLAIFSKFPIIHYEYLVLFRNMNNPEDQHQRICLHAVIQVPHAGLIHVFNTHSSLNQEAREKTAMQIVEYMKQFKGPAVLMGDLNAEPTEKSIQILINDGQLCDTWNHLHPESKGFTFSCLEKDLSSRIDYILFKETGGLTLESVQVVPDKIGKESASDHRPVVASFSFDFKSNV